MTTAASDPLRRTLFLQELGLQPQWQRKALAQVQGEADLPVPSVSTADDPAAAAMNQASPQASPQTNIQPNIQPDIQANIQPSTAQAATFDQTSRPEPSVPLGTPGVPAARQTLSVERMNWQQLQQAVASCTACGLCRQRQQTVLGSGVPDATWMLVGDGPDAQDESAGQAFTGQTGLLLDNIMHAVDAGRKHNVYLTTLVKCRAQDASGLARAPEPEEIAACRPFLQRQIALLQPQLVVSLGKLAAQALRQPGAGPLRGVVHKLAADLCRDVPTPPALIASWHPAIVLQQPLEKRQVWADLCLAQQTLTPRAAASVGDDDIPF